jgi:hypothetical protein
MNKLMKFGIPGLVVMLVVLFLAGSFFINKAVKVGIETIAPEILGVSVTVESVSISPFTGSGGITGLVVGNPDGYNSKKAFSLGEIYVDLAPSSLLSGIAHVEEITIKSPEFVYERKLGGSNIGDLLNNLSGGETDKAATEEETKGGGLKFKVDKISIENGRIDMGAFGAQVKLPLPSITLEGIGKDGGVTADEAITEVLSVVFGKVTESIAAAPAKILEGGGEAVEEIGKGVGEITKGIKGLFNGGK